MSAPVEGDDLPPVLWLGGGSGAGKTTVSRTIAHRYDLAWYRIDAYAYAHYARLHGGQPAPSGSQDERWLAPSPEQLAEEFVTAAVGVMGLIVEDLRAMSDRVAVVVEGPQLFPSLVAPHLTDPGRALWMLPTREFQHAMLAARAGDGAKFTSDPQRALDKRVARNQLLDARTRQEAVERGLTVLDVDGSRDIPATVAAVAEHFAPAIATGPRATDGGQRRRLRQSENAAMVSNVRSYLADLGDGAPSQWPLPFACECVQLGCEALVEMALADHAAQGAVAAGHPAA